MASTELTESHAAGRRRDGLPAGSWRTLLLAMTALPAGAIIALAAPAPTYRADAELAVLLQSMALIKLAFAGPMLALAWWRLGRQPLTPRQASGYLAATGASFVALALIFSLAAVPAGAALFHLSLFGFAALVYADRGIRALIDRRLLSRPPGAVGSIEPGGGPQ